MKSRAFLDESSRHVGTDTKIKPISGSKFSFKFGAIYIDIDIS